MKVNEKKKQKKKSAVVVVGMKSILPPIRDCYGGGGMALYSKV
jgi:hypothetical protein